MQLASVEARGSSAREQRLQKHVALALPAFLVVTHAAMFSPYVIDDAYITFTAAKNVVAGAGPVFVPGERIEATSSMLWALLLTPFEAVGVGALVGSKILGALCALAVVLVTLRLFDSMRPAASQAQRTALGLLIATSSTFVLWSSYGMENGLVALLLVLSLYAFGHELVTNRGWRSAIPIFLLETVRPEGFMFVALFVAFRLAWVGLDPGRGRASLRSWLVALLLPLLAYELCGYLYFGHLLPNPASAKIGATLRERVNEGLHYLSTAPTSFVVYAFFGSCLLALPALFARHSSWTVRGMNAEWRDNPWYVGALAIVALQLSFTALVGGDWMPQGRFVSSVVPLLALTLVCGYSKLAEHADTVRADLPGIRSLLRAGAVLALLGMVGFGLGTSARAIRGQVGELQAACDRALGGTLAFLNRAATPGDVVACSDIGFIGYHFKGRVYDWWGLANEEITALHQALGNIDPATVLKHRPRFIVLYSNEPTLTLEAARGGMAASSRRFLLSPEFVKHYRQAHTVAFSPERHHVTFQRVD